MSKYKDKCGAEILEGMTMRHDNGNTEQVYATTDGYGNSDLGILATNPDYAIRHPDCDLEYYSLSTLCLREWEIVNQQS